MNFFSKLAKTTEQSAPATGDHQSSDPHPSPDLFNSIKVVAGAAQSHFRHEPATCDNSELAGATADLLGAASDYGKLDKTQGLGQYVEQAENYLKEYKTSNSAANTESAAGETGHGSTPADPSPADASKEAVATEEHVKTDTTESEDAPKITSGVGSNIETEVKDEHKEDIKLSGVEVAAEPEAYGKPEGGSPAQGEDTDEAFSKKTPGNGEECAIKPDSSAGEYEKSEVGSKLEGEAGENLPSKPSPGLGGAKVEASDEYDQSGQGCEEVAAENLSDKPSGGHTAAATEDVPAKESAGDDISEKIKSEASAGGFGNFSKVAGDFLKK